MQLLRLSASVAGLENVFVEFDHVVVSLLMWNSITANLFRLMRDLGGPTFGAEEGVAIRAKVHVRVGRRTSIVLAFSHCHQVPGINSSLFLDFVLAKLHASGSRIRGK